MDSVHGGITFFRGTGASAQAYVESDHYRADEYYLADGDGVAERFVYGPAGLLVASDVLESEQYRQWVDWIDPQTGEVRGKPKGAARLRQSDGVVRDLPASPRFAEMTVNCDKSLSVAAALSLEVSVALDEAQREAAQAMSEYVAQNAVTRVGARGDQRLVKVERFEAAAVVHRTSRAGDPHRHIHLQWNTRVYAEGKWRGLWTAPTLAQQGALRGIGEAMIRSHSGLRQALATAGLTFDSATGKVVELADQAALLSKRREQIEKNLGELESAWRAEHPNQDPDPATRRDWDRKAWALDRPGKKHARNVTEAGWIAELRAAGLAVDGFTGGSTDAAQTLAELDRDEIKAQATAVCESKKSAWSLHDIEAAIADQVADSGAAAGRDEIVTYIQELAHETRSESRSISDPRDGVMPDHVKHITSARVIAVEDELKGRLAARAVAVTPAKHTGDAFAAVGLEAAQAQAAAAVVGTGQLVVIEGAAGSGKTTLLKAAKTVLDRQGRELIVLAPTLKASQEAAKSIGSRSPSVHKLLHSHGFRWDQHGRYTRLQPGQTDPETGALYRGPSREYRITAGARVVVDEAGMIDQDTALALSQLLDQHDAVLILMGDRAQLPAVGRGGVLDMATKIAFEHVDIDIVHRFTDPDYADLSLRLRDRDNPVELFDDLYRGGHVRIHDSEEAAFAAMAADAAATIRAAGTVALAAPTNDQATALNLQMQTEMAAAGRTRKAKHKIAGTDGIMLRHGDIIMTRSNDPDMGVANRYTYRVKNTHKNGDITVIEAKGKAPIRISAAYVAQHVHLGYAATEYGVQGATETTSAGYAGQSSDAGGVYVLLTRGREENTLHLTADSLDHARAQFVDIMNRDNADRGIERARVQLAEQIAGLDLSTPPLPATGPVVETPNPESTATEHMPELAVGEDQVRPERLESERAKYAKQYAAWKDGRDQYRAEHGFDPEAWTQKYTDAVGALDTAKGHVERITADLPDRAEAALRAQHVNDAQTVNASRVAADRAGLLSRKQARADLDAALDKFEQHHGYRPAGKVQLEPFIADVRNVRRHAVAEGVSPELEQAKAIQSLAEKKVAELKATKPNLNLVAEREPVPPTTGTPAEESAKDAAYAVRKTRTTSRGRRAVSEQKPTQAQPVPGRSPEQ